MLLCLLLQAKDQSRLQRFKAAVARAQGSVLTVPDFLMSQLTYRCAHLSWSFPGLVPVDDCQFTPRALYEGRLCTRA